MQNNIQQSMKKIDVIGAGNVDIPYPNTIATRLIGQKTKQH